MKRSHHLLAATALALAGLAALPALAQAAGPAAGQAASAAELASGEVRKVDRQAKKITLKHGAIKNLDMPPMTMVFQVRDPALLDKVQAGDKVRFAAVDEAGKLTVTHIEPAK